MIHDLSSGEAPEEEACDVCIVGAGAAGISIARELAGTSLKVVLVESGSFENTDEQQELLEGKTSGALNHEETYGEDYLEVSRQRFIGGATNHWGGMCRPMESFDLEERDWVPLSGWPLSKEELGPYEKRAEKVLDLLPFEEWEEDRTYDWDTEDDLPLRTPIFFFSKADFQGYYKKELEKAPNIELLVHANLTDVRTSGNKERIDRSSFQSLNGHSATLRPSCFVLACGGIENPRLLLNFRKDHSDGLGNSNGFVGKCFMEHPHYHQCGEILTPREEAGDVTPIYSALAWIDLEEKHPIKRYLGIKEEVMREEGLLNVAFELRDYKYIRKLEGDTGLLKDVQSLSNRFWDRGKHEIDILQPLTLRGECTPEKENRVDLTGEKDALGMNRAHLTFRVPDQVVENYHRAFKVIARSFGKQYRGRIGHELEKGSVVHGGCHHLGTTRMSTDPRKGVVDADCRVHGIDNLYIAGSSVFPTSGYVNPTFTIVSLALRLSDHLKKELEDAG